MTLMVSLTEILYRNTPKVNAISHISTICKIAVILRFISLRKKKLPDVLHLTASFHCFLELNSFCV